MHSSYTYRLDGDRQESIYSWGCFATIKCNGGKLCDNGEDTREIIRWRLHEQLSQRRTSAAISAGVTSSCPDPTRPDRFPNGYGGQDLSSKEKDAERAVDRRGQGLHQAVGVGVREREPYAQSISLVPFGLIRVTRCCV